MLPGANGIGVADPDRFSGHDGADYVRDQAGGGNCRWVGGLDARMHGEKRLSIGSGYEFETAFAVGIGIKATHRFIFTVSPYPFSVFIAFVGGNIDDRPDCRAVTHRLQQMHSSWLGGVVIFCSRDR